ncbi:hypothetical protein AB205_0215530 [Aquarana catesbeiana]|uniref:Uncharacterized protein n=1 Tax=Aquarana catesbeiana TaxID=8400 RepID=A0A2G9REU9_AQUCT|nr:hypothetical protein AB205_0215530 [Aquarana catesbeiana]
MSFLHVYICAQDRILLILLKMYLSNCFISFCFSLSAPLISGELPYSYYCSYSLFYLTLLRKPSLKIEDFGCF